MSVKNSMKSVYSLIAGVGLLGLALSAQAATITLAEQGGTVDAVNMADITVALGTTTTLDIWAVDIPTDTFGGIFGLSYDAAAVSIGGWTFNTAVWNDPSTGGLTFDDGAGTVSFMEVYSADFINGAGASTVLLGTITFNALAEGITSLSLFSDPFATLSLTEYTPIALGANVTISAVPLPAAVWLFGSALVGVIGLSRRKQKVVKAA